MKLTTNQQLIQEALLGRIQQRSKSIQENVPEQQPNLLAMLTAAVAQLASETDGNKQPIDMLVETGAFVLAKEIALANLAKEVTAARDELAEARQELEQMVNSQVACSTEAAHKLEPLTVEEAEYDESNRED